MSAYSCLIIEPLTFQNAKWHALKICEVQSDIQETPLGVQIFLSNLTYSFGNAKSTLLY